MATQFPGDRQSGMVARIKRILLEPRAEWERIDSEPASVGSLMTGWVAPLAAIGPVAGLIGGLVFGYSAFGVTYRPSIGSALATAVIGYALALLGTWVLSRIIDALAPSFGGNKDKVQAMKVAAYASTASFVAGIFSLIPAIAFLSILGLYSLYLLYLGLPRLMKAPEDKALGYTAVTILAAVVLFLVIGAATTVLAGAIAPRAPLSGGSAGGTVTVPGMGTVDLGKLEAAADRMEAAAERAESGEPVEAVPAATLQAMLPEAIGEWQRGVIESSSASAAGMGGSQAEAEYAMGEHRIELKVVDMAAAGALMGLGSAFNVESSRTTETGYERIGEVDGRMTTEEWDRQAGRGRYGVVVANRFVVEASGTAPGINALKGAVAAVDLDRLEGIAR